METCCSLASKLHTVLGIWEMKEPPQKNVQWDVEVDRQSMDTMWVRQKEFAKHEASERLRSIHGILRDLKVAMDKEASLVGGALMEDFDNADDEARIDIVRRLFKDATNVENREIFEKEWHNRQMNQVRALLRLRLWRAMPEVITKLEEAIRPFQSAFSLELGWLSDRMD